MKRYCLNCGTVLAEKTYATCSKKCEVEYDNVMTNERIEESINFLHDHGYKVVDPEND